MSNNATSASLRNDESADSIRPESKGPQNYKGFVAGVFSGVAKLTVGHPFDTIKVRLQTAPKSQFSGPLDCVMQTLRKEGFRGLYKGATPPLVGWAFMDSVMLGSLTFYRRILHENLFRDHPLAIFTPNLKDALPSTDETPPKLPTLGHAMAGILAGWTVSFIAAPVEHIKARLQVQYASDKAQRLYQGPLDCTRKIYRNHGVRGLYHGLTATLIFRSWFFVWWGTYDLWSNFLSNSAYFNLSTPAVNFWAGGLSAQLFWLSSYPSDVIKQRIMTDSLEKDKRKFWTWRQAAIAVYKQDGYRGYWRGFLPCFLRAFPANGTALLAFEGVMRALA